MQPISNSRPHQLQSKAIAILQVPSTPLLEATIVCADRCIELIRELAGGEIEPTTLDAYPKPLQRHPVVLQRWELSRHLGLEIPPEDVERILYTLGFHPRAKGRTGWTCVAPSYRVDVTREIDLIEEVARHYGIPLA